jgi:hypothetical protein
LNIASVQLVFRVRALSIASRFRPIHWSAIAGLTLGLAGCSTHPLPGDWARTSTFDIVEKIRCEAQDGLRSFAQSDPHGRKIIAGTTIGYDFRFDVTETNDLSSGELDFRRPGANSNFLLDVNASAFRKRQNVRTFRVVEDLTEVEKADCSKEAARANWIYPITGAVGIGEVVRTYVRLEKLTDIRTSSTVASPFPTAVFADDLDFTTTVSGSITPTVTLNAVVGSLRLTHAKVTGAASRSDVHSLIVALARDHPSKDFDPGRSRSTKEATERRKLIEDELIADPRTVTALAQRDLDARNRVILELQRLRNLKDDEQEAPRVLGQRLLDLLKLP